ncbi:MAG: thiamine-binding protein [Balneolaceae bacterium]|nr:thiamine-binding protein [Balneolaceae bacterium]
MRTIAQLTVIPLATHNPTEIVRELLEHIAQFDLQIEVGYLSTTVIGDTDIVFGAIRDIYNSMALEQERFRLHVELLSPEKEN